MKKYLKLYEKWMETGEIPAPGLCNVFDPRVNEGAVIADQKLFDMFRPTPKDFAELSSNGLSTSYWASGHLEWKGKRKYDFSPLRQTIVLFMAAMNDEL